MSDQSDKPTEADAAQATEPDAATASGASEPVEQQDQGEDLGKLMGTDSGGTKQLEIDAVRAAEAAVRAAEAAIQRVDAASGEAPAAAGAEQISPRKLWALRGILLVNFALMGIMIAMPTADSTPHSDATTGVESAAELPQPFSGDSPFVSPLRDPRYTIPRDDLFDEALVFARDGNYEQAAVLMQKHVEAHAALHPSLLQTPYLLLAHYLRLSGRTEEAIEFEGIANRLIGASHLPEDLWNAARAAERNGDAREMRRAYARLLLQQNMLTPTQRAVVTEAYLKFGESYRIEAEQGREQARAKEADRLRRLREGGANK